MNDVELKEVVKSDVLANLVSQMAVQLTPVFTKLLALYGGLMVMKLAFAYLKRLTLQRDEEAFQRRNTEWNDHVLNSLSYHDVRDKRRYWAAHREFWGDDARKHRRRMKGGR